MALGRALVGVERGAVRRWHRSLQTVFSLAPMRALLWQPRGHATILLRVADYQQIDPPLGGGRPVTGACVAAESPDPQKPDTRTPRAVMWD
jgi:hypothetical protein